MQSIKKRVFGTLALLLAGMMLFLTSCQNATYIVGGVVNASETVSSDDADAASGFEDDSDEDILNEGGEVDTEIGEASEEEADYSDIVFDPELTEGKLSVYFIQSDNSYTSDTSTQHAGDSMIVIGPDGTTMLIDMNTPSNAPAIVSALDKLGIDTIDYLLISHQHLDHIGGYSLIFRYKEIKQILTNAHQYTTSTPWLALQGAVAEKEIPVSYLYSGDTFMFGEDVQCIIYNPFDGYMDWTSTATQNNGSVLIKFVYGDSSFMFGGDLYAAQERVILETWGDELQADVIKMNHHGYDTSNIVDWVSTVNCKIAGAMMSGVTSETVMYRYITSGAVTLQTALDGAFVIYTDGDGTYDIQVSQDRWVYEYGILDTVDGHMTVE